uniref:Uncharacterized protein n=1 Tax=Cacopsylla melanoneura TaxID=428564 RepID=A0A8D8X7T1_9HEMI
MSNEFKVHKTSLIFTSRSTKGNLQGKILQVRRVDDIKQYCFMNPMYVMLTFQWKIYNPSFSYGEYPNPFFTKKKKKTKYVILWQWQIYNPSFLLYPSTL